MGLLTQNDSKLYRGWFKEMAMLRGFTVKYQYVIEDKVSIHSEITPTKLSDPIDIDVIYEENPKKNTLKNIGWVSENPNDKPYIMMFPYDTPNITTEARIQIPPTVENVEFSKCKEFRITSITTLMEYPDCYICTIVPVFQNEEVRDDYSDSNFNYIGE